MDKNDSKEVSFEEISPLLSSALASNIAAMQVFAQASEEKRRKIVDETSNITNKKDMKRYLKSIC